MTASPTWSKTRRAPWRAPCKYDVSFGHWTFLRILWKQDGLTQRALSEAAGVMKPTTYAALTGIEKLGYIERR